MLPKYDATLIRLEDTGELIGLQRLLLRLTAELSIEAKTKEEKVEVQYLKK